MPYNSAQQASDAYSDALSQANAANESRYQEILAGYGQRIAAQENNNQALSLSAHNRYDRIMDQLKGYGEYDKAELEDQRQRQIGQMGQGLTSRGLSNSTVYDSLSRGISRENNKSRMALNDQIRRLLSGTDIQLSGDILGMAERQQGGMNQMYGNKFDFMERKTEAGPDPSQFAYGGWSGDGSGGGYNYLGNPGGTFGARGGRSGAAGGGGGGGRGFIAPRELSPQDYGSDYNLKVSNANAYNNAVNAYNSAPSYNPLDWGGTSEMNQGNNQNNASAPYYSDFGSGFGDYGTGNWGTSYGGEYA